MRLKIFGLIFIAIVVVASTFFIWLTSKEESSDDTQVNSLKKQQTSLKEIKAEQVGEIITKSTDQKQNHVVTTTSGNSKIVNVFNFQQNYASLKTPNKEAITIGNTAFVKDGNNQWWKKENAKSDLPISIEDYKNTLDSYSKLSFKFLHEESCESSQCFVYSAIDPRYNIETKFWFEADSKLLRKTEAEVEGYIATVTFKYNNEQLKPPPKAKNIPADEPILNYLGSKQKDNSWSEEKKQQKLKELEELQRELGEIE